MDIIDTYLSLISELHSTKLIIIEISVKSDKYKLTNRMAFHAQSRSFSYLTEHFTRFFNTYVAKKNIKGITILDNQSHNPIPFNTKVKKELSTSIFMKKLNKGKFATKISFSKQNNLFFNLSHHMSLISFWKKSQHFPIKCKIKTNDLGEKIAEPYIAKHPSPINLARLTNDFAMNFDDKVEKLQGNVLNFPFVSEMKARIMRKCLKNQVERPNALTKYLQKKRSCNNVYRGNRETCAKGNSSIRTDSKYTATSETKENKARTILNNLISKFNSMKLMKSSGFITGELMNEAINKQRINFTEKQTAPSDLTSIKKLFDSIEMPNCEKSLVRKFGEPSEKSKQFVESILFNRRTEGETFICSRILKGHKTVISVPARSNFRAEIPKENMSRSNKSNVKLKKIEDYNVQNERRQIVRPYGDTIPIRGQFSPDYVKIQKKNTKLRKQNTYKPKSRLGKRRRKFSFSKIPIQPNVKGSVIFVNETTQHLEDPCKILSVNFKNDDMLTATEGLKKEEGDGINHPASAIKAKSKSLIKNSEVKRIPIKAKIFRGYSEDRREQEDDEVEDESKVEGKIKQYSEGEVIVSLRTKKYDNSQKNEERYFNYSPPEPIIRRKKISKLDKNITSFITTVFPEEKLSKPLSKFKKNKSVPDKFGFISLDNEITEISTNVLLGVQTEEINELKVQEKPKSASSIASDFCRKIAAIPNFTSEGCILRKIDNAEVNGKELIVDTSRRVQARFKKGITVSPGLTRPVTQKTAHLDILKSKPFTPISNMWKNTTASTGRIPPIRKNTKKKAIKSTNNLAILEIKDHNLQQTRRKSTTSWKSKCECEEKRGPNEEKDEKSNLPVDWDYEGAAPSDLARKWATMECPPEKVTECPVTSEDMRRGPPCKRPLSAAALNRCNFNECRNRMRSKKVNCGIRGSKKTMGTGC